MIGVGMPGYTLIFPSLVGVGPGTEFHFAPHPERVQQDRRALTTLVELPQAIYRESHGEGIQDVTLEGTFGVRARQVNGRSLMGHQVFELLDKKITEYWKALAHDSSLQVEYHDHQKGKHHYAEIMTFSTPVGIENKMHDRYVIGLKLYAPIEYDATEPKPNKTSIARELLHALTTAKSTLMDAGSVLAQRSRKASETLNRHLLQPLTELTQALGSFVSGVIDYADFPLRGLKRLADTTVTIIESLGDIVGDAITYAANTLRQIKRTLNRAMSAGELFTQPISNAAQVFEAARLDPLTSESSALTQQTYTGVRQAKVRGGDTLQKIALRELKNTSRWHDIALVNGFDSNADLTPNATILIPSDPNTPQSAVVRDVSDTGLSTEERLYGRDLRVIQTNRNKLSVSFSENDLATVAGKANLEQAVTLKTRTHQGTLLEDPNYGLRPLIGKAQSPENADLLKFGLRVAAESDPRIASASVQVETRGNVARYHYHLIPVGASGTSPIGTVVEGI